MKTERKFVALMFNNDGEGSMQHECSGKPCKKWKALARQQRIHVGLAAQVEDPAVLLGLGEGDVEYCDVYFTPSEVRRYDDKRIVLLVVEGSVKTEPLVPGPDGEVPRIADEHAHSPGSRHPELN